MLQNGPKSIHRMRRSTLRLWKPFSSLWVLAFLLAPSPTRSASYGAIYDGMGTQIEGYSTSCCSMRMASFKARNRPSPGFKAFAAMRWKACTRCSKSVWRTLRLRPPARQFLRRPLNDAASLPKWE